MSPLWFFFFSTVFVALFAVSNGQEDHLDQDQMSFLRYVLPDYFKSIGDGDLEVITAWQTDEKLTFNQQKQGTFRVLEEKGIKGEVKKHFTDLYRLEDTKRERFTKFMKDLQKAVIDYLNIDLQREIKISAKKEQISNFLDRLDNTVCDVMKHIANTLESSRILNSYRKKTVDEGTRKQLEELDV